MSYLRVLPQVDLATSPLLQEELLKQLSDPSMLARKPHPSDFSVFREVTDQLHRGLVAISSYPTKGPGETEEVTQLCPPGTPHMGVQRCEDSNRRRGICPMPILTWESYFCCGSNVTNVVWFCSFSITFPTKKFPVAWLSFPGQRLRRGD